MITLHKSFVRRKLFFFLPQICLIRQRNKCKTPVVQAKQIHLWHWTKFYSARWLTRRAKYLGEDFSSLLAVSKWRLEVFKENRSFSLTLQIKRKNKSETLLKVPAFILWCWTTLYFRGLMILLAMLIARSFMSHLHSARVHLLPWQILRFLYTFHISLRGLMNRHDHF